MQVHGCGGAPVGELKRALAIGLLKMPSIDPVAQSVAGFGGGSERVPEELREFTGAIAMPALDDIGFNAARGVEELISKAKIPRSGLRGVHKAIDLALQLDGKLQRDEIVNAFDAHR